MAVPAGMPPFQASYQAYLAAWAAAQPMGGVASNAAGGVCWIPMPHASTADHSAGPGAATRDLHPTQPQPQQMGFVLPNGHHSFLYPNIPMAFAAPRLPDASTTAAARMAGPSFPNSSGQLPLSTI
jgi:hypothetical protein